MIFLICGGGFLFYPRLQNVKREHRSKSSTTQHTPQSSHYYYPSSSKPKQSSPFYSLQQLKSLNDKVYSNTTSRFGDAGGQRKDDRIDHAVDVETRRRNNCKAERNKAERRHCPDTGHSHSQQIIQAFDVTDQRTASDCSRFAATDPWPRLRQRGRVSRLPRIRCDRKAGTTAMLQQYLAIFDYHHNSVYIILFVSSVRWAHAIQQSTI
jgi:hypothetical protein